MGKTFDRIAPELRDFIARQQMFFVATAPLGADGHVNLSPKGLDTFRVIDDHIVAYLDLTGSGNETSAHLEENRRITLMFCAFEGPPMILRLYGTGQTVLPATAEWTRLRETFGDYPGVRQIIIARIDRAMTSCGFAVPRYEYVEQRNELIRSAEKKGPGELEQYRREKNTRSIDGIVTALGKQF
jgi:hypothetical protein